MAYTLKFEGRVLNGTFSEDSEQLMKLEARKTLKAVENLSVEVKEGEYVERDCYGRVPPDSRKDATEPCASEPRKMFCFVKLESVKRKTSFFVREIAGSGRTIIEMVKRTKAEEDSEVTSLIAEGLVPDESVPGKKAMRVSSFATEVHENHKGVEDSVSISSIIGAARLNISNTKRCDSDVTNELESCKSDQFSTEDEDEVVEHRVSDLSSENKPSLEDQNAMHQTVPGETARKLIISFTQNLSVKPIGALSMNTILSKEHSHKKNRSRSDCMSSGIVKGNCDGPGSSTNQSLKAVSNLANAQTSDTAEGVCEPHHGKEHLQTAHSRSMYQGNFRSCPMILAKIDKTVRFATQTSESDTSTNASSNASRTVSSNSCQSGSITVIEDRNSSSCSTQEPGSAMNAICEPDEPPTSNSYEYKGTSHTNLSSFCRPNIQDMEPKTPSSRGSPKPLQTSKINHDHTGKKIRTTAAGAEYDISCDTIDKQSLGIELVEDHVTVSKKLEKVDCDFLLNNESDSESDESYHTCIDHIYRAIGKQVQ
ncbi:hypothetical protein FGB62_33g015 [Gracilaria domingensis]|nr:hypothetical protein FGB62_33g015 [Gracilaria domingensis]